MHRLWPFWLLMRRIVLKSGLRCCILGCVVFDDTALRSLRSLDVERVVAMMVLSGDFASWRTNSRPRPRLAPVMQ